jgi:hypothetical protein
LLFGLTMEASSNQIILGGCMVPRLMRKDIKTLLQMKLFNEARQVMTDYIWVVQTIVRKLRPLILEKFPLPDTEDGPESPALLNVKNDPEGSSKNMIEFYFNGEKMYFMPFSTGTAPLSCIDNFPTEIMFLGVSIPCTFTYKGQLTNSEAVFASEKIKDEILPSEILKEKFGDLIVKSEAVSTRQLVLSLTKLDAKLAPRKLTPKDKFFGEEKLWDQEVRIWAILKAQFLKFSQKTNSGLILRAILFTVTHNTPFIIQEIQANTDPWTALATDDSVGLLGAISEITSLILQTDTTFEEICPPHVLELMK